MRRDFRRSRKPPHYVARAIKLGISSKALVISKQAWNRKIDLPEPKENQAFPSIIGLGVSWNRFESALVTPPPGRTDTRPHWKDLEGVLSDQRSLINLEIESRRGRRESQSRRADRSDRRVRTVVNPFGESETVYVTVLSFDGFPRRSTSR